MGMKASAQSRLDALYERSPRRRARPGERFVVLSDLHMGKGDRTDDFAHNGALCLDALEHYYFPKNFTLILNGDVEELLRVPREDILRAWKPMYELFDRFRNEDRLIWLIGNHEILPQHEGLAGIPAPFDGESVVLDLDGNEVFVFHGHQAGVANSGRYNRLIGWALRFFGNGLGIGNRSVAHDSAKRFKLEKAAYEFSRRRRVLSVMGHTHRPLFESLSKRESLGIRIEKLCREFADPGLATLRGFRRAEIRRLVRTLRQDYLSAGAPPSLSTTVYGEMPVPCLFNSGCAVGKRGLTTLELKRGRIALVAWSGRATDPDRSRRQGQSSYRTVLRREDLSYIYARIELLTPEAPE